MGAFWLVLSGCGSAVRAAAFPRVGIGLLIVSLAFGLTVLTMAFAFGHILGGHFNPAVTAGLWLAGHQGPKFVLPYIAAQVVRWARACSTSLRAAAQRIAWPPMVWLPTAWLPMATARARPAILPHGRPRDRDGHDDAVPVHHPGGHCPPGCQGFWALAIGLGLTLIHRISIPVTNTSVNPARSTGPALFVGGLALEQLWLFWLAPLLGAAIAGLTYRYLTGADGLKPIAAQGQRIAQATTSISDVTYGCTVG